MGTVPRLCLDGPRVINSFGTCSAIHSPVPHPHQNQAISQEHSLGCAVACVASRCGLAYREALGLFEQPELAWIRGFYCVEVVEALRRGGLNYRLSGFIAEVHAVELLKIGTIVFVSRSELYPFGHYLVRAAEGWMNSWINFPEMISIQAGFQRSLPGAAEYILYEQ